MKNLMYFSKLLSFNSPKNKLQREALVLLHAESNLLVYDVEPFIKSLRDKIDKLNYENQKCQSLTLSRYGTGATISIALGAHFTVGFHLYPVKNGGAA